MTDCILIPMVYLRYLGIILISLGIVVTGYALRERIYNFFKNHWFFIAMIMSGGALIFLICCAVNAAIESLPCIQVVP